jgi:glucose-fructose oxidoreductase
MTVTVGESIREREFPRRDHFGPEIEYFSDCILERRRPEPSGREGLADVRIIRALLESARSGKAVRLRDFEKRRRPTAKQEIRKPPVEKPELVGVESGSRD